MGNCFAKKYVYQKEVIDESEEFLDDNVDETPAEEVCRAFYDTLKTETVENKQIHDDLKAYNFDNLRTAVDEIIIPKGPSPGIIDDDNGCIYRMKTNQNGNDIEESYNIDEFDFITNLTDAQVDEFLSTSVVQSAISKLYPSEQMEIDEVCRRPTTSEGSFETPITTPSPGESMNSGIADVGHNILTDSAGSIINDDNKSANRPTTNRLTDEDLRDLLVNKKQHIQLAENERDFEKLQSLVFDGMQRHIESFIDLKNSQRNSALCVALLNKNMSAFKFLCFTCVARIPLYIYVENKKKSFLIYLTSYQDLLLKVLHRLKDSRLYKRRQMKDYIITKDPASDQNFQEFLESQPRNEVIEQCLFICTQMYTKRIRHTKQKPLNPSDQNGGQLVNSDHQST